jgi:hypothetical protein
VQEGDLVKFRDVLNHRTEELTDWKFGVLLEYAKLHKMASVLCNGEVRRISGRYICKAGKKDVIRQKEKEENVDIDNLDKP